MFERNKTTTVIIKNDSSKIIDYDFAENFMNEYRQNLILKNETKNLFWLLQHEDILTCGLDNKNIHKNAVQINRGGGLTYHNKGQLICYAVVNLIDFFGTRDKVDISEFISFLENIVILALQKYNVKAFSNSNNRGVWLEDDSKIASIGIHISKYVTKYGIAVNVNNDLQTFQTFSPCGIKNCVMNNLQNVINKEVVPREFGEILSQIILKHFD